MTAPTPAELRDRARDLAEEAATAVRAGRRAGIGPVQAKSTATDPVTAVDRATEQLIVDRLRRDRPGDAILGEESGERQGQTGVRWVIDPIDGTVNFVYGIAAYAVSIGAELDGRLVAGAVVDIVAEHTYAAAVGDGATGPDGSLQVTDTPDLAHALIGTGFAYDAEHRRRQAETLVEILPRIRDIRRMGSAALDLCAVAAGRLDGFYETGLQPWDLAAGAVLVREAGGVVHELPIAGRETVMTIAAGPAVAEGLIDELRLAGAGI
jgi:myo-inositol-1(or 4)-monophosphatase